MQSTRPEQVRSGNDEGLDCSGKVAFCPSSICGWAACLNLDETPFFGKLDSMNRWNDVYAANSGVE
jgi:hypothetical protein